MDHDQTQAHPTLMGMDDHRATYEIFLRGVGVAVLHIFFVLVALVDFRFVNNSLNPVIGFGGILVGTASVFFIMRTGGGWRVTGAILVLYMVLVALNLQSS